jgi:signal transduction histidine kinase
MDRPQPATAPSAAVEPVPPVPLSSLAPLSEVNAHLWIDVTASLLRAEVDDLIGEIDRAVQLTGRRLAVDIMSLCGSAGVPGKLVALHQWRATGWMDAPFELDAPQARWWLARRPGDSIIIDDLDDLPEEAAYERSALIRRGTRSLAAVVLEGGTAPLFLIAEMQHETRRWTADELRALGLVGESLGAALQRRDYQRKLVIAAQQGQGAAEERSRFLATFAHELRTPLTAVMGYAQLLEAEIGALPEAAQEHLRGLLECTQQLNELIDSTMTLAQLDCNRIDLHVTSFDLRDPLHAALAQLAPQAQQAGVALRQQLPAEPLLIRADRGRLQQVVVNLLSNGIKFTPAGGWVTLRAGPHPDGLQVEVEDSGIGIAERDHQRIFEMFTRVSSGEQEAPGAGLGLTLVKRIAVLHGGRIELDSAPGRGSRFVLVLPRTAQSSSAGGRPYLGGFS